MKTLRVIQLQSTDGSPYVVHATGCRDIYRDVRKGDGYVYDKEYVSFDDINAGDFDAWTTDDMDVRPCAKKA